jgi:hypothetical protein
LEDSGWEGSGISEFIAAWGNGSRFAPWASGIGVAGVLITVGGSAGTEIVVGLELSNVWNWSKLGDEDISDLLSHVVELVGSSIGDDVSDIGMDFRDVHDGVGESFFEKSNWVLEDGGPDFDSFDIWLHSLAILEIDVNGGDHLSDNWDTLDDVSDVFLLEIRDGLGELNLESLGISKAWLDLLEVVVLDESIEESSNELDNLVVVETGNGGDGENFGDWHSRKKFYLK